MALIVNFILILIVLFLVIGKKNDLVLLTYAILYVIYVHVSPTIVAYETNRGFDYLIVQMIFFIFFFIPFYFTYSTFKFYTLSSISVVRFIDFKLIRFFFNFFLMCMPFLILFVLFKNNLIYRRLGIGLVDAIGALPLFDKIVIKIFDWYAIFIVTTLYIYKQINKNLFTKYQFYSWLFLCFSIYLINSKLNLIILFLMILVARSIFFNFRIKYKFFLLILIFLFLGKVTNDIRYSIFVNQSGVYFDYKSFSDRILADNSADLKENENLAYRLNGVILAADLFDKVGFFNFDLGYFNHILKMSVFGDHEYLIKAKSNGITAGKIYLQSKYLNDYSPDNYSCLLTDVFGATGVLGLFLLAFFVAIILKVSSIFIYSNFFYFKVIGIYFYSIFIFFEMDIITNINKLLLFIIPLIIILKFVRVKKLLYV